MKDIFNFIGAVFLVLCLFGSFLFWMYMLIDPIGRFRAYNLEAGKCYYLDGSSTDDYYSDPFNSVSDSAPPFLDIICILEKKDGWFKYAHFEWYSKDDYWSRLFTSTETWYSYPFTWVRYAVPEDHLIYSRLSQ